MSALLPSYILLLTYYYEDKVSHTQVLLRRPSTMGWWPAAVLGLTCVTAATECLLIRWGVGAVQDQIPGPGERLNEIAIHSDYHANIDKGHNQ